MADFHVVVQRELTDGDRAILESRSYVIVFRFGPVMTARGEPPIPHDAWTELEGSTGYIVRVPASDKSEALQQVRTALNADEGTVYRAYRA